MIPSWEKRAPLLLMRGKRRSVLSLDQECRKWLRGVRYFRHGRSTWCHIFRTCRADSPNTRPTTGGSLNGGLARSSPFSLSLSVLLLCFSPLIFFSFFHAVDGDECHCALRENVSTMYEVFRDVTGNRLYASLPSYHSLFSKRARWSASRKI